MTLKQLTVCTLKKSASIFGEIGAGILLFGSTILASAIIGVVLAYIVREVMNVSRAIVDVLANPISVIIGFAGGIVASVVSLLTISFFGIPLWAILLVPVAIVVYSFLWCVNRELTEEDYAWAEERTECINIDDYCVFFIGAVVTIRPMISTIYSMSAIKDGIVYSAACVCGFLISVCLGVIICICYNYLWHYATGRRFDHAVYHHYFKVKK